MKRYIALTLSIFLAQAAAAQRYRVIDLGTLNPVAINAEGEVAGNISGQAYVWTQQHGLEALGLMPGGTFSVASGINDRGVVAGTADGAGIQSGSLGNTSCSDMVQPFTWTRTGGFVVAPSIPEVIPGLEQSHPCVQQDWAYGLNNRGQVVGSNVSLATEKWGFVWDGTSGITQLEFDYQTAAAAINDRGVIAGRIADEPEDLSFHSEAAIFQSGTPTELGSLISPTDAVTACSAATALNHFSQVVGWSTTIAAPGAMPCPDMFASQIPMHAFIWDAKHGMTDLGTLPGDSLSIAVKINRFGVVIGESGNTLTEIAPPAGDEYLPAVQGQPFVWSWFTGMLNLNHFVDLHSGWVLQTATDVNGWGQVVGTGLHNGATHGYLLTPEFLIY